MYIRVFQYDSGLVSTLVLEAYLLLYYPTSLLKFVHVEIYSTRVHHVKESNIFDPKFQMDALGTRSGEIHGSAIQ